MAATRTPRAGMRLLPRLTWRDCTSAAILCHTCVALHAAGDPVTWPGDGRFALNASQVAAVMCIGDSWMTGFAAGPKNPKGTPTDYRGASWGCGDGIVSNDETVQTLGTLLRRFNPQLQGLSRGTHDFSTRSPCNTHREQCGLNAAVDGASLISRTEGKADLNGSLLKQAHDLRRWIDAERPRLLQEWKVLSIMPSWGDQWWTERNIERIRSGLHELFSYLRRSLPKTYVNLVDVSEHPSSLDKMLAEHTVCRLSVAFWKAANFLRFRTHFNSAPGADEYARKINSELRAVALEFNDGENFLVRVQPVMHGFTFQRRLLDHGTCFHPNQMLIDNIAIGLLQNMVSQGSSAELTRLPVYDKPPDRQLARQVELFRKAMLAAQDLVFR